MTSVDDSAGKTATRPLAGQQRKGVPLQLGHLGLIIPILIFAAVVQYHAPQFLTLTNILQVLRQISVPGIIAVAVTLAAIAGRFDLSVGSILSLTSVLVIDLHTKMGPELAIVIAIAAGVVAGALNGLMVGVMGLNSVIATLGSLSVLQGVTFLYTGGTDVLIQDVNNTWFAVIGRGYLLGIPIPIIVFAFVAIVLHVFLSRSSFGRRVYAVGGNEVATSFSGIDPRKVVFWCYVIVGLCAGIAAVVFGSRVMAAQSDAGVGYELTVLAAIILGGTSITGGAGSVGRTVIGIVVLGFIQNGLLVAGLPYYAQWIVTWIVIIAAVWVDRITNGEGDSA